MTDSEDINKSETGLVYILTNPSFKNGWVKIGKSSRPVDLRSRELDNTAVPLPFDIYATLETSKYKEVEKLIHKTIDRLSDLRIRQNREFFNVSPEEALDLMRDVAQVLDDGKIITYQDNKVASSDSDDDHSTGGRVVKRSRFKFSMVGIKVGDEIVFAPTGIPVRVASDDSVEYEGRIYKLSPFVGTFMPEDKRNLSGAYQGPKYFTYKGKVLNDLRKELEGSSEDQD